MNVITTTSLRTVAELRRELEPHRRAGRRIGFVPTMGALHDGHASLMRTARSECDLVVASCYVNPAQFGVGEDLARYPRMPESDLAVATAAGVDVLWLPRDADVYGERPGDHATIHVGRVGEVLEGASRPGHFDGVATVVARLLGATAPDVLYLGRKDYQQLVVLRRLVADLLLPVRVRAVDTVREPDGLAMSSRNAYLDASDRRAALAIPGAIDAVRAALEAGERSCAALRTVGLAALDAAAGVEPDYVELVGEGTLDPADRATPGATLVVLVAASVGGTRLIDNERLVVAPTEERP